MKRREIFIFIMSCLLTTMQAQHGNHNRHSTSIPPSVEGIYYNFSGTEAKVTRGYSGFRYAGDIVIPSTVSYGGTVYNVVRIENLAFKGCNELKSISIPEGMESIGDGAFYECYDLASVTIPSSVTSIGEQAFYDCRSLASIDVESGNANYSSDNGVLYNKDKTVLISCPGGKTGSYLIPSSVTTINDEAFNKCSNLTSITIPEGVTSIGRSAFSHCSSLTSIIIPSNVKKIKNWTFYGCTDLTSITIPEGVTDIGEDAWGYAFGYCGITSVVIPNSMKNIGNKAFIGCKNLTSITIPESVTDIGRMAFSMCENLTSFNVESGNTNYSSEDGVLFNKDKTVLVSCPGGKTGSYLIPSSVTKIGEYAFYYCNNITSITIPSSVTKIETDAFTHCEGLESITIFSPNLININRFGNNFIDRDMNKNCIIKVPTSWLARYKNDYTWERYNVVGIGYLVNITANKIDYGYATTDNTLYDGNATATVTATANSGRKFVNWTTGKKVISTANPYSFRVTEDVELVANFK